MSVQFHSPAGLLEQSLYHPVAAAVAGQVICMAGQCGVDTKGKPVASDLGGQVLAALRGVMTGMASAGAGPKDLLRLTVFVVEWNPGMIEPLESALAEAQTELGIPSPLPPLTVIGVQALYRPELLVEIEAIAAIK